MRPSLVAAWLFAAVLAARPAAGQTIAGPWVELGADNTLSVRMVVGSGVAACPRVVADGNPVEARQRGAADGPFGITVCTAEVPAGTAKLTVDGAPMPTLPATIGRIAVFGDTGCRVEGRTAQSCNDAAAWPFPTIAKRAAARKPDLVIHVGDYYYRESPCPAGAAGCAGTPHGDNWPAWKADFFDPAAPLLASSPWVMTRGNHELCRRGGRGWFRLLDPRKFGSNCADETAPYRIAAGGLSLLEFDDAGAEDFKTDPQKVAVYAAQLAELLAGAPPHSWLVTHRPVWALAQGNLPGVPLNLTDQAAIKGHVPDTLDMVVSGHLHDFTSYDFGPGRPSQLIAGTGGDTLLPLAKAPLVGAEIDGMTVQKAMMLAEFGYFIIERDAEDWAGTFYSPDDAVLARCRIAARSLDCR